MVFVWRVEQFVTAESVWFSLVVVLLVGLVWCLRCEFLLFVGRLRVGSVGWLAFSGLCGPSFARYCPVPGIGFCSRGVNIIGFVDCWLLGFELMVFLCVSGGWGWWLTVDVGFCVLGLWCCLLGFGFMVACVW